MNVELNSADSGRFDSFKMCTATCRDKNMELRVQRAPGASVAGKKLPSRSWVPRRASVRLRRNDLLEESFVLLVFGMARGSLLARGSETVVGPAPSQLLGGPMQGPV